MTNSILLLIMFLFFVKHFVADFLLQPPFMLNNKGKFNHIGGYAHSGFHSLLSGLILVFFFNPLSVLVVISLEFVIHFLVDLAKVRIVAKYKWSCLQSKKFWWITGLDQLLHYLTYLVIISILIGIV